MKVTVTYQIPANARESVFSGIRSDMENGDYNGILEWIHACDAPVAWVAVS